MGDPANGATSNPEKPWERPWSLEEMRQSAGNWSLAGDAGMLLYLQGFSQRMIAETHAAQEQVNQLLNDVKFTDIRIQNSFNDFIMLANTQFVENRVYDEDVTQDNKSPLEPKEEKLNKEKTKEEREAELIPKISQALDLGLQVMDTAFEKLDISEANSDSEEESPYKVEPLLEPKDPYITRPLPYLIGSQAFFQDDHVGLVDIPSDEEQEDQGTISDSESSETDESGDESDADISQPPLPRQPVMRQSSASESDESGDLFGEEKSENEQSESDKEDVDEIPKNRGPASFTDELASKLGNKPSISAKQDENENLQPERTPKERKRSKSKHKNVEEPDLFGTEPPDEDEDSPFSKTGGLFSTSKGLFDDDDDDKRGGSLFDDVKRSTAKKISEAERGEPQKNNNVQNDVGSKESEDFPAQKVAQPAASRNSMKPLASKPPSKPSGGLFDESDEDDLFAPPPLTAPVNKQPVSQTKKTIDLFMDDDDEEDDDDLFSNQPTIKVTQPPKIMADDKPQQASSEKKKLPAGAVSIFGAGSNPLSAAIKAQRQATPEDDESSDEKSMTSTTSSSMGPPRPPPLDKEPSPAPSSNSLFAEEPEDDLFASKAPSTKNKTKSTINKGLFEAEEEEDLFTQTLSNKPKQATETKSSKAPKGLFEDEEESDDLFGNLSAPPPSQPAKKKPVGGVSIFGDRGDLFSSSTKPEPVPILKETEKPAEPVRQLTKQVSLFDEDESEADLFSSTQQPNEVEKKSKANAETRKPSAAKGLFDDDDDLFGQQVEEAPSVDLFGPSSPIKQHKSNPLAAEIAKEPLTPAEKESPEPPKSLLLKGATITASSTDLFGEIDDDGDVSPTPTATKKIDPLAVPGATITESSSDIGSNKSQVGATASQSKKPVGGVSLFGGLDMNSALRRVKISPDKESPMEKSDLFKGSPTDHEDGLFGKNKHKSAFQKPPSEKQVERTAPPSVKNTSASSRPSSIGKLKMNLAIDPTALLPGAKRPTEDTTDKSTGFEDPAIADTLYSAQKGRAKIPSKRRPPTRRHLQANVKDSTDDEGSFSDGVSSPATDNSLESNGAFHDKNFTPESSPDKSDKSVEPTSGSQVPPPRQKSVDASPSKMNGATSDGNSASDDLFASPKNQKIASSSKKDSEKIASAAKDSEDLFSNIATKSKEPEKQPQKPAEDTFDDIFSDSSLLKRPSKKASQFEDDIFSSIPKKSENSPAINSNDIFSSESLKTKKPVKTVATPLLDDDDDIFKTMPSKTTPAKPTPTVQIDEDDIFASSALRSSSKRLKKAVTLDDDLFSDSTDIFADITIPKKDKKASKSSNLASGDSLFRDADMEDIFASAKSSRKSSSGTKKKLDAGESSIFDDPLSAFDSGE